LRSHSLLFLLAAAAGLQKRDLASVAKRIQIETGTHGTVVVCSEADVLGCRVALALRQQQQGGERRR
jgi:hypothetical protein